MYEKIDSCPICKDEQFKNYLICKDYLVSGESFAIMQCQNCELLLTSPRPTAEHSDKYYDSSNYLSHNKDGSIVSKLYQIAQLYTLNYKYKFIKNLLGNKERKILDIGCGTGDFLSLLHQKKWTTIGFEPNEHALEKAKEKGYKCYNDLSLIKANEGKFEIITLWHVLEHIHDLNDTIKQLKKLLRKQGYLIIAVPNPSSWDAIHYQEYWAAYDVPRHLYHFTSQTITKLFKKHNLSLINQHPLWLDSFYISLLSEKYKHQSNKYILSIINGCKSNIYGKKSGNYSSLIYTFQKK